MHDEFRVAVEVEDPQALIDGLRSLELGQDKLDEIGRLAVTHEHGHVFLYSDSRQAAEHAAGAVRDVLAQQNLDGQPTVWRWHPLEERWEDAASALPTSEQERATELGRRDEVQALQAAEAGEAEWEVRVTLVSHHDARAFAEVLQSEGLPVKQRWRYVLVGAETESQALSLAERLRAEAPEGSELEVQGSGLPIWNMLQAPARPFAFFGGLAQ